MSKEKGKKRQERQEIQELIEPYLDKLRKQFQELFNDLDKYETSFLEGQIEHEDNYIRMCNKVGDKHYDQLKDLCYDIKKDIIKSETERVITKQQSEYKDNCDDISLIPFKAIYLQDDDHLINLSYEGSRWTSSIVTKKNPKDGSTYTRYLTSIEADPRKDVGSKMDHRTSQGNSMGGLDWIFIETENPLIPKPELIFPCDIDTYKSEIELDLKEKNKEKNKELELSEPILAFGYLRQEGYSKPEFIHFPENVHFFKNRIKRKGGFF
jgi:hypothetical protein